MKVAVVYAHHSHGCGPTYTIKAFQRLGFEVVVINNADEYYGCSDDYADLFFCQDSGLGIDFRRVGESKIRKSSMWYWDSRFNRVQRNPGDDDMAKYVSDHGGWVFHAQRPDLERCANRLRLERQSWLPIGGDPYEWLAEPKEERIYSTSFIGNCYDSGRGAALDYARNYLGLYWPGPHTTWFQDAAKIYRQSWCVFHAPLFYNLPHDVTGERIDYDVTMRYYEAACCGVPVLTPPMPDFEALGFQHGFQVYIYHSLEETSGLLDQAKHAMWDPDYSKRISAWLIGNHTYENRVKTALRQLESAGVIKDGLETVGYDPRVVQ